MSRTALSLTKRSCGAARVYGKKPPADLVRFVRLLPDEEREQAIELLRAIQDRHWYET
jgi:hypothetical protein